MSANRTPYLNHLVVFQLRAANLLTLRRNCGPPALRDHIRDVVLLGSQEEMIRTNAARIVALMANIYAVRNRSVGKLKRLPVGAYSRSVMMKYTVAVGGDVACPWPTSRLILHNLIPEYLVPKSLAFARRQFGHQVASMPHSTSNRTCSAKLVRLLVARARTCANVSSSNATTIRRKPA
jgi:hypothetical protein